jgi:hypothetical protein
LFYFVDLSFTVTNEPFLLQMSRVLLSVVLLGLLASSFAAVLFTRDTTVPGWRRLARADPRKVVPIRIALKQRNVDVLEVCWQFVLRPLLILVVAPTAFLKSAFGRPKKQNRTPSRTSEISRPSLSHHKSFHAGVCDYQ